MAAVPSRSGGSKKGPSSGQNRLSSAGRLGSNRQSEMPKVGFQNVQSPKLSVVGMPQQRNSSQKGENQAVTVAIRVRPLLPHERAAPSCIHCEDDHQTLSISREDAVDDSLGGTGKRFTVDRVFDSRTKANGSQAEVFHHLGAPLISKVLDGYNICICAYGHTGSGKTFTMLGSGDQANSAPDVKSEGAGILPRFLGAFEEVLERQFNDENMPKLRCEYVEVYNEQIRDLLAPNDGGDRTRKVHVHPKFGVIVDNLEPVEIGQVAEALEVVQYGNVCRAVSATTMNSRSSRSHAIFTLSFEQATNTPAGQGTRKVRLPGSGSGRVNKIIFVDLAGREGQEASQNRAQTWKEMVHINTSLFHLATVVDKIADGVIKQGSSGTLNLADFRNSKLTLLLSQALVGSSMTTMVTTVSPLKKYYDDTLKTLQFARSAKKIKTKPVVTKTTHEVIGDLKNEVDRLKQQLELYTNGGTTARNTEVNEQMADTMAVLVGFESVMEESEAPPTMRKTKTMQALRKSVSPDQFASGRKTNFGQAIDQMLADKDDDDPTSPFLSNMNADPALSGLLKYRIRSGQQITVGSDPEECDIIIHGIGISDEVCDLSCTGNTLEIALTTAAAEAQQSQESSKPRVLVNGRPLVATQELRHGDCVLFGYAHAFRVVIPAVGGAASVNLDIASMEQEDESSEQFQGIQQFLQRMGNHTSQKALTNLERALHKVCPVVDEVNGITAEIRRDRGGGLRFEVHILTDLCVESASDLGVVVCMVWVKHEDHSSGRTTARVPSLASGRSSVASMCSRPTMLANPNTYKMGIEDQMIMRDEAKLIYVWSVEKFLERTEMIREMYEQCMQDEDGFELVRDSLRENSDMDPWRESRVRDPNVVTEVMMTARTKETEVSIFARSPCASGFGTPRAQSDVDRIRQELELLREEKQVQEEELERLRAENLRFRCGKEVAANLSGSPSSSPPSSAPRESTLVLENVARDQASRSIRQTRQLGAMRAARARAADEGGKQSRDSMRASEKPLHGQDTDSSEPAHVEMEVEAGCDLYSGESEQKLFAAEPKDVQEQFGSPPGFSSSSRDQVKAVKSPSKAKDNENYHGLLAEYHAVCRQRDDWMMLALSKDKVPSSSRSELAERVLSLAMEDNKRLHETNATLGRERLALLEEVRESRRHSPSPVRRQHTAPYVRHPVVAATHSSLVAPSSGILISPPAVFTISPSSPSCSPGRRAVSPPNRGREATQSFALLSGPRVVLADGYPSPSPFPSSVSAPVVPIDSLRPAGSSGSMPPARAAPALIAEPMATPPTSALRISPGKPARSVSPGERPGVTSPAPMGPSRAPMSSPERAKFMASPMVFSRDGQSSLQGHVPATAARTGTRPATSSRGTWPLRTQGRVSEPLADRHQRIEQ